MSHDAPETVPLITYLWVCGLSLLSAIAGYLSRYLGGGQSEKPVLHLIMDVAYCELAGLTTYFFTQDAHLGGMRSIMLVCLGSHMGARLMFAIQNIVTRQIQLNMTSPSDKDQ